MYIVYAYVDCEHKVVPGKVDQYLSLRLVLGDVLVLGELLVFGQVQHILPLLLHVVDETRISYH